MANIICDYWEWNRTTLHAEIIYYNNKKKNKLCYGRREKNK